jgi:hypothetical protein
MCLCECVGDHLWRAEGLTRKWCVCVDFDNQPTMALFWLGGFVQLRIFAKFGSRRHLGVDLLNI